MTSLFSWKRNELDAGRIHILSREFRPYLRCRGLYYVRILTLYSVLLWLAMSIFFGGIYKVSYFVGKRADLYVIDLDHGTVGSNITNIILNAAGVISPQPQWKLLSAMRSRRDAEEFIRHNGWGAIVINRGASSGGLQAAAQSSAYNPSRMLTVLLASGRNALVSNRYIEPQIDTMAQYTVTQYNVAQVNTLKKQQQNQNANIAPTDRLSLIGYTTLDTAPYGFGIAPVAPTYMLFVSLACTLAAQVLVKLSCNEMFSYVNHHQLTLYFHSLMLMWSTLLSTYGALAVLAFRGPGYTKNSLGLPLTCGRFFAILTSLDIALFVTSQWLFFWITILPPDFVPVFFIFTMVTTSASGIVALELVPKALRWIVVVPGYNNAELFRYIVSGAHPQLGLHIGILLGEMVLMFALNSVAIMVRQYWLISGVADSAGWFKTSIFYKKKPQPHITQETIIAQESTSHYSSLFGSEPSTAHTPIDDDEEQPDQVRFTLYGS